MNYQFLVGERFAVEGEVFTVEVVRTMDDRVIAEASTAQASRDRIFPAETVMEALVSEEIELFQAGGLRLG